MLTLVTSNGEALVRGALASLGSTYLIMVAVGVLAVALGLTAAAIRHPILGVAMILFSVAISGYRVEVSWNGTELATLAPDPESLTLRAEYLFVPLGACSLLVGKYLRREPIRIGRAVWLVAWIGVNVLSSVLRSPALGYSLRMVYFYVVGVLAYTGIINFAWDQSHVRQALILCAGLVAAEAVYALFLGGRWLDFGVVRLHGSFQEPVVFAGFLVPISLILLGWGLGSSRSSAPPRWLIAAACAGLLASALSMSRASWGMSILGVGFIAVVAWRWRQVKPSHLAGGVLGGAVLTSALMLLWLRYAPTMYSKFDDPFPDTIRPTSPATVTAIPGAMTIGTPSPSATTPYPDVVIVPQSAGIVSLEARLESSTWMWRLNIAREVLRVAKYSPLIGFGTLTFGQTHDVNARLSATPSDGWIPTGSLLVLHDTGLVGLAVFGIFLAAIMMDTLRAVKSEDFEVRGLALGGLAGMLAWLAMEQLSTNMILGFGWVFLGLVSAASSVAPSGIRED